MWVEDLTKAFGATRALRSCSFDLYPGEVHALVGENGSGKSTLVKIMSGVYVPDSGTIAFGGREVRGLHSPAAAQRQGIMTVFQEVLVAEARPVLDNIWLGADSPFRRAPSRSRRLQAEAALTELLGHPLNLAAPIGDLSLSDRQTCCIVRALVRSPKVLLLDEATSALDVDSRDRLFRALDRLRSAGVGIVLISHRMDEIAEMSDRVTVMRSGRTVATLERGTWSAAQLAHLMTGTERVSQERHRRPAAQATSGEKVISASNLQLAPGKKPIDLDIEAGELIGLAGLEGHGQDEFLAALAGRIQLPGQVVRHSNGVEHQIQSARQAAQYQVAYVPRDRRQSTFTWMSIRENFGMPTLSQDAFGGWLQPKRTARRLGPYITRLRITLREVNAHITTLSGGNQQKVVISRWLAAEPRVLLLNDPTRGIDVGAKEDLYGLLDSLTAQGVAIVMLSTELDEHVKLMDRVLVFREHELSAELEGEHLTRVAIVAKFFDKAEDTIGVA